MADPHDVSLEVVGALAAAGLPCAIGGALAFGRWVRPRATLDADINVADMMGDEDERVSRWDEIVAEANSSEGDA